MPTEPPAPPLLRLIRRDVVESVHRGHLVVADPDGNVLGALGDASHATYVRSAAKPFQALATLELLAEAGVAPDLDAVAIACASHVGTDEHQIEAARLLAEAGLDESALATPPALPAHLPTACAQGEATSLAHNCSGKHAGFLWAHTATGGEPARYLDLDAPVQVAARRHLVETCGAPVAGPGLDGCGAPAWILPLAGLATGFARLAAGATPALARVRDAMTARPDLVGGPDCDDTALMLADARVVAKRGAEAVLGLGVRTSGGRAVGVAVKVEDGHNRAPGPIVAAVLAGLGCRTPARLAAPPVLGGGREAGVVRADDAVTGLLTA